MKNLLLNLLFSLVASTAFGQTIEAPTYYPGDTWVYQDTTEKGATGWNQTKVEISLTRSTGSHIYYTTRTSGSTQPQRDLVAGAFWSRVRNVNGKETLVNKPLSFPLYPDKTWEVHYSEQHPNKTIKTEEWLAKYTVIGNEAVEVGAGKFDAIKIEAEGTWVAELEPKTSVVQGAQTTTTGTTVVSQVQKPTQKTATGRTYKAFWYVPEIKRWVKSVEEYYGSGGEKSERFTEELISFKSPAEKK